MKVREVFDFSSEIHCSVNLISLEELLFNDLKNSEVDNNSQNKLRWIEFKDMTFEGFNIHKNFLPEKIFIEKYIKRIRKGSYLYSRLEE